jgi:hypothetical protein
MEWVWENGKSRGRGKCDWDVIYDKRIKEKDKRNETGIISYVLDKNNQASGRKELLIFPKATNNSF